MASSLLWMLASGSVVVMPPPTQEGWAAEGLLRPWFHYAPLRHPSDVDRVIAWLIANDAAARQIVQNANGFVRRLTRHNQQRCRLSAPFAAPVGAGATTSPIPAFTAPAPERARPSANLYIQAGLGAWRWSGARDGSVEEANERYSILTCLLQPQVAKTLIEHAATAWAAFNRASSAAPERLAFSREFELEMVRQSQGLLHSSSAFSHAAYEFNRRRNHGLRQRVGTGTNS